MFETLISAASEKYKIPESWINAVIEVESSWNPKAYRSTSPKDTSWGLMQLTLPTARGLGWTGTNTDQLFDPALNIDLGTKLLAENRRRFGDDFRRVYSAYNSGSPDAYTTSAQVAAHVQKAVEALSKYVYEAASDLVESPVESSFVALIVGVLLWYWVGWRKK